MRCCHPMVQGKRVSPKWSYDVPADMAVTGPNDRASTWDADLVRNRLREW